jgi:hypothetical protein
VFAVFGRVPLFYYLLHIPLIHLLALVVATARTPAALPWLFTNHPMHAPEVPPGYTWPLPLVYTVTVLAIAALYAPCRWYAGSGRSGGGGGPPTSRRGGGAIAPPA